MPDGAQLSQALRETLLSYMTSALPVGNHQSQRLLGQRFQVAWERDLFRGPYIETVPPYRKGASLSERFGNASVGTPDRLFAERFRPRYDWTAVDSRFPQFRNHRDRLWTASDAALEEGETCLEALWKRPLFDHQSGAFERIVRAGRSTVVATGTGSGKTECFQIPLLYSLLTEPGAQRRQGGIRALLVYPLNALVEDQIMRFRRLLFWINLQCHDGRNGLRIERPITFGRYTGDTPLDRNDRSRIVPERRWSLSAKSCIGKTCNRPRRTF